MDPDEPMAAASEVEAETMDFLSGAWSTFAFQALRPAEVLDHHHHHQPMLLRDNTAKSAVIPIMEKSMRMDDGDCMKSVPPWKYNDLKSCIWMQQAMHPELNYNGCFRKKWLPWKMSPFKSFSVKKWVRDIKDKRKEEKRLQKAEVHAAVSIAGLAAALATIAAEKSNGHEYKYESDAIREAAIASAAALMAAQCKQVAESIGARREQLNSMINSAMSGTTTGDILTLTAAATTSLRGAATLKARGGCKARLHGSEPVLPIDQDKYGIDEFDFEKCRLVLAKGAELFVETADGKCMMRLVSLHLNSQAKVILKTMKRRVLNVITSKKECFVLDQHAELYKEPKGDETDTCYQIVLTTTKGMIKLDMVDDYQHYKMWATTINHMLMLSMSVTKHELRFCNY